MYSTFWILNMSASEIRPVYKDLLWPSGSNEPCKESEKQYILYKSLPFHTRHSG